MSIRPFFACRMVSADGNYLRLLVGAMFISGRAMLAQFARQIVIGGALCIKNFVAPS